MSAPVWSSQELDLGAYLARIGYDGPLEPTADTLRMLHRRHVQAIPFENLDIMLGRPVELDLASLQAKLVAGRRGGHCSENNLLFAAVLERLGYPLSCLSARIASRSGKLRPPTHMCIRADVGDSSWLVDVGFGGDGLLEPIPMRPGEPARQGAGAWQYALADRGDSKGTWALRSVRPQGWTELYTFTSQACQPIDYTVFNWYMSTHPRSAFTRRLIVQRIGDSFRRSLAGTELTLTAPDWTRQTRTIATADLPGVLATEFGIELTPQDVRALKRLRLDDSGQDQGPERFTLADLVKLRRRQATADAANARVSPRADGAD